MPPNTATCLSRCFKNPQPTLAATLTKEFLKGLAESIRANGLLAPLLVRPRNERLEIVFGAQRYRAAQMAEV